MKLIVGLGNPGKDYAQTKLNVGFWVVDAIAQQIPVTLTRRKFDALWTQGQYRDQNFLLVKPMTYMNRSGFSVQQFVHFFQVVLSELLVIVDDVSLPVGTVRVRPSGSAGGHNGLRSLIAQLGSDQFARLRCGIGIEGRPADLAGYVLSGFSGTQERSRAGLMVERAREAAVLWLEQGTTAVMNRYNGVPIEQKEESSQTRRAKEEIADDE